MHVGPGAASDGGQGGAGGLTRVSAAKSGTFGDAFGIPEYCREVGRDLSGVACCCFVDRAIHSDQTGIGPA